MTPRRLTRQGSLALSLTRIACLLVAAGSVVGMFLVTPGPVTSARADASSAITVKWANDSSSASSFQPARDTSGVHYAGFKNLSVTVDQTSNIGDQAVEVSIKGFAGTAEAEDFGGQVWTSATNYVEAMQCWGVDPKAANFRETCQWGGRYALNNGLGATVYSDNTPRVGPNDIAPDATNPTDVPFRTFGGTSITGRQVYLPGTKTPSYPLLDYLSPATTNEVQGARIKADGTGTFGFETQSSDQAPQSGCGSGLHLRCWLVLVPRGSVYGGHGPSCSNLRDSATLAPYAYGRTNAIQGGSPLNPSCDYWDNRINIPLDFNPTGNNCTKGNAERRVIGSQLLLGAMASWQPQLCKDLGTTFSFSTNPDAVARQQLLDNEAGLAFTSFPIVESELDSEVGISELKTTALSYAPVALTSAVVAYNAEGPNGRIEDLRLSPRLVAKLLTQSYVFGVPTNSSSAAKSVAHLGAVNQSYFYFNQDPDFQALNPDWSQFTSNPAVVLPGPAGADAIRQVWKWILSDKEAAAWLAGSPDKWGMTVNPYYLPKGDPKAEVPTFTETGDLIVDAGGKNVVKLVGLSNIDGTPFEISKVVEDRFPKSDESLAPIVLTNQRYRFGSIQASPYSDNFLTAARTAFRANPGSKNSWDPTALSTSGVAGDWVSGGAQIPGQRFMIAITDSPSAQKYSLTSAQLRLSNSNDQFVAPSTESLNSAVSSGLAATSVAAVRQVDPSKVTAGGFPLTTVVYAAVNLSGSDSDARKDFSRFIAQVTTKGQLSGTQLGELPPGYAPLSPELAGQAQAASVAVATYISPTKSSTNSPVAEASNGYAQDSYSPDGASASRSATAASSTPQGIGASSSPAPTVTSGRTPTAKDVSPIAQMALTGSLATGLSGALFAPLLFRGRRLR